MLRYYTLLLFFCSLFDTSIAQSYNIEVYTAEDGLNASDIYDIHQDSKGYLWIATYGGGISRYDGVDFRHFSTSDGLANDKVLKILEDKKGKLWFATFGGGVSCYDGARFINLNSDNGLAGDIVNDIAEDKEGNLWFACRGKGISRYDGHKVTNYYGTGDIDLSTVICLTIDHLGRLWMGRDERGVVLYDGKAFSLVKDPAGLRFGVWKIFEDRKGRMWFGMYGGGVSCYDGRSFLNYTDRSGLNNNIVYSIFEDKRGNLWFATDDGGANIFDGKAFSYINESNGLSHNRVRCITSDSEGNIWLGTEGGVNKYQGKAFINYDECSSLPDDKVTSLFEDNAGNLWVGTFDGGAIMFSPDRNNPLALIPAKQFTTADGLSHNRVWKIMTDSKGRTWFATAAGICVLENNKIRRVDAGYSSLNTSAYALMEDHAGRIWIGTDNGIHILWNGSWTTYTTANGLSHDRIRAMTEDRDGNIWIGTYSGGVTKYDGKTFSPVTGIAALNKAIVYDIRMDQDGHIWFATYGQGIVRYDPSKNSYTSFTQHEGLSADAVYLLVEDSSGNIWAGTTRGLDRLDRTKLLTGKTEFTHYGYNEGFKGIECNQAAGIRGKNGNLWFGTKNGMTRYIPGEDHKNNTEPRLHMTDIMLFYEHTDWKMYSDSIDTGTGLPAHLSLPYNKNHLTFDFTGISFVNSEQVRYRFRLNGFDQTWSPVTNVSHAIYSNLSPGDYTFEVLARNSYGIWSSKPLLFSFTISPPFWKTNLAYVLFTMGAIGIVVLVVKLRTHSLERERNALTAEIEKRKEAERKLTCANEELQTFMYKASHDIRAPLSSTIGLIDLTKREKNKDQLGFYIDMIDRSIKRLDSILLDILETARIKINRTESIRIDWDNLLADILLPYVPGVVPVRFETDIRDANDFYSDKRLLDAVFRNIIDNSVNYRRPGASDSHVRISITGNADGVRVQVSDNGIGISEEVKDHVFNMFYRGTENSKGTGLGLYIAKNAVDRLGGTIHLQSEEGSGTVITIDLPGTKPCKS